MCVFFVLFIFSRLFPYRGCGCEQSWCKEVDAGVGLSTQPNASRRKESEPRTEGCLVFSLHPAEPPLRAHHALLHGTDSRFAAPTASNNRFKQDAYGVSKVVPSRETTKKETHSWFCRGRKRGSRLLLFFRGSALGRRLWHASASRCPRLFRGFRRDRRRRWRCGVGSWLGRGFHRALLLVDTWRLFLRRWRGHWRSKRDKKKT